MNKGPERGSQYDGTTGIGGGRARNVDGVALRPAFDTTLRERGFAPPPEVYKEVYQTFLTDLRKAQKGESSSISFIRNPLPESPLLTDGFGQATVYGGTNYETSTFEVRNGQVVEESRRAHPLKEGENVIDLMVKDYGGNLIDGVAGNIGQELIPSSGPFGELDGTPTARSQGVKGQSIELAPMGDTIRRRVGRPDLPATFANDTVAIAYHDGSAIIGTGLNKAIIVEDIFGKRVAVNLESGGQTVPEAERALIERIDAQLPPEERDKHEMEKLAAGGHLPLNFNLAAADLGLPTRVKKGEELSALAETDEGETGELARTLVTRSAMLEAAQLAAIHRFMGGSPITLVGDGSLIRDAWRFQELVQKGLQSFGVPEGGVTILTPDDVAMKGARGLLTGAVA